MPHQQDFQKNSSQLKKITNTLNWGKLKFKLISTDLTLKDRLQLWKCYYYSKIIYHLLSLLAISISVSKQLETKSFGAIKKSLGISKSVSRERLTKCLNINPPSILAHRCKDKLHQTLLVLLLQLKKKLWSISNAITMRTSF